VRADAEGGGGPRALVRAEARGTPAPLRALAELRFRLLVRRLRGRGGVPELVARVVMFAVAIPAGAVFAGGAGLAAFRAVRAGHGILAEVAATALFFGVFQAWIAIALSLAEREALDLRRLLVYPVPPWRVYAYGLAASVIGDPFALFWCLLLGGAWVGAAAARPGAWVLVLAAAYALFVAATAATVAFLQELLGRLLRIRRARVLAVAAIYVGLAAGAAWASTRGLQGLLALAGAVRHARWGLAPAAFAAEATKALYAGRVGEGVAFTAGLGGVALALAWAGYRLALADARSGGEAPSVRGAATGQGWRLPGRLGPLLEKEAKYVLRHPLAAVLLLILPALAGMVARWAAPRIPADAGEVVKALPLFGFALYGHLATQAFWLNAFGWDRGGARAWFLAPVSLADLLLAKNLAAFGLSLLVFGACAVTLFAVGGAPPAWAIWASVALHAGIAPWFAGTGNLVSILNPRAASFTLQRGSRLAPASAVAGMAIVSGCTGLFAAPVLLALRLEAPWVLMVAWCTLGVVGATAYGATLPWVAGLLARRREPLLEAVAGDEE
jgi:ABC-2 type transport system permease protein